MKQFEFLETLANQVVTQENLDHALITLDPELRPGLKQYLAKKNKNLTLKLPKTGS
jgi:hypothetical protein